MMWTYFISECDVTYAQYYKVVGEKKSKLYLTAKLQEEKGELSGAVAKFLSGNYDHDELVRRLKEEAGDILWCLAMLDKYHDIAPIALRYDRREEYTLNYLVAEIIFYGAQAVFRFFDHNEIMEKTIEKIRKRQAENTVYGEGVMR